MRTIIVFLLFIVLVKGTVWFQFNETTGNALYSSKNVSLSLLNDAPYLRINVTITNNQTESTIGIFYFNSTNNETTLIQYVESGGVTGYYPTTYAPEDYLIFNDSYTQFNLSYPPLAALALYNTLSVTIEWNTTLGGGVLVTESKVYSLVFNNTDIQSTTVWLIPYNNTGLTLVVSYVNVTQTTFEAPAQLLYLQQYDDLNHTNPQPVLSVGLVGDFFTFSWFGAATSSDGHIASHSLIHVSGGFDTRYNYSGGFEQNEFNGTLLVTPYVYPNSSTDLYLTVPEITVASQTTFTLAYIINGEGAIIYRDANATASVFSFPGPAGSKSGLETWQLALIIAGGVVGGFIVIVGVVLIIRRARRGSYSTVDN